MKLKNSLGLRLFTIFSIFMIAFVCLLTFLQFFVVGRMYSTSLHVQQKERELYNQVPKFIYDNVYFENRYNRELIAKYDINKIKSFEIANSINLLIFDSNMKTKYITTNAQNGLNRSHINYIQNKVSDVRFNVDPGSPASFRVYGRLGIPSKYIAVVFDISYGPTIRDYVVVVIPEVFTTSTSNILRSYILYIVMFSLLITFAISGFFSYIVARPISDMNKSASRMAKMDFTAKCKIERNDEIGNLAGTLNYLSSSLESTLKKLYDANDKLKKDLDLQRELDMLRKDFIAAITHEFKTPITLIRGYSESIKDNIADGEDREFAVDTIIHETERIDKLVNDLLELSTLESVGYKLNISSFSIGDLIDDIAKKYEKVMEMRKIVFKTQSISNSVYVDGDPFRIEQVVTNFLNNAINHTPAGKEISLSLQDTGDRIVVSVQNQGNHISDDEIKRIWEKFYRVEKSRNKKYGGTGLGLAISSAILRLHNSSYRAENTPDGVKFYFTLKKK